MESDAKYLQDQEDRYMFLTGEIEKAFKNFYDIHAEFQKVSRDFPDIDIEKLDDIRKKTIVRFGVISYLQKLYTIPYNVLKKVKLKKGIKKVWFNMDNKKKLVKLKTEHNVLVIKLRNLLYRRKKINSELVKESEKHYTEVDLEKLELLIVKTSRKLMRILKVEKYLDSCMKIAQELKEE